MAGAGTGAPRPQGKEAIGKGVKFATLSDDDKKKWAQAMPDAPAEWAKSMQEKGIDGWQIWNQFKAFSNQAGHQFPREFGVKQ